MPRLIRMYITQVIVGFVISAVFVGALMWFNIMNLWHLVTHSSDGVLAVFLLWLFNGIVFAGVQFSIRIMRMKDDDDDEPRGGTKVRVDYNRPVRVKVAAKPRDPFQRHR
ncbi:MAG: hypothetical protein WBC85_04060 [Planktotalea sp.]|uniref:hypothetical protein n=1 Tax=Planktotalea sp. TaxID=2029877 RepID=UPI003C71688F